MKRIIGDRYCRFHPNWHAATCPECYDLALKEQRQQRMVEQAAEHQKYLIRVARGRAEQEHLEAVIDVWAS